MAAEHKELKEIQKSMKADGELSIDRKLIDILKEKLNSKPCLNQGFVLDGFPHTYAQAQLLFFGEQQFRIQVNFDLLLFLI